MKETVVLDVSALPLHGRGAASPTWWGTAAFILIEATGFALAGMTYLYLMSLAPAWPLRAELPDLGPGTIVLILLVASVIPNLWLVRQAKKGAQKRVQVGLVAMSLFGTVPLIVRWFEFGAINVKWDTNAYGSVLWLILGLHTTHLITDLVDTLVLTALMFTEHGANPRRMGDVEDNSMYWNFVVLAWLPLYLLVYWVPRL